LGRERENKREQEKREREGSLEGNSFIIDNIEMNKEWKSKEDLYELTSSPDDIL